MSIARAFTTRRAKQSLDMRDSATGFPQRSNTTTKAAVSIRNKISAPVELIHTTNMLSYNAPDLFPGKTEHSPNSVKSDDESDTASKTASTPPTSPDTPYPNKRATSPEPNHLSCYFTAPAQALPGATTPTEVPAIPQRAPSHTKKSYEGLNRHRSTSRLSEQSSRSVSTKASLTFSRSSSSSTSTSVTSVSHTSLPHPPKPTSALAPPLPISTVPTSAPPVSHKKEYSETHPFGHELAQVSELAEEYGAKDKLSPMEQEEQDLLQRGLRKFNAEDYLSEIRGLKDIFFEAARPVAAMWI